MVYLWDIFAIVFIGMMLYFMFFDRREGIRGCFGMMHDSGGQELKKEVESLKEEVRRLKR